MSEPDPRHASGKLSVEEADARAASISGKSVLGRLQAVTGDRLFLLLSGEAALHRRLAAADACDRLADWVAAGRAANINLERMVAIDLDDLSGAGRERLARLFGADQ